MLNRIASFVDYEDNSCSKEYLNRENPLELFDDIVGCNSAVKGGK